jgi:hypothetical protein
MKTWLIFLFLVLFIGCNYIDDIADDAVEDAIKNCPTKIEIQDLVLDSIDDAIEYYKESMHVVIFINDYEIIIYLEENNDTDQF